MRTTFFRLGGSWAASHQSQTVFGIDYHLIIFMQDKIAGVKIVNPAFFFKFDAEDIS